MDEEKLAKAIVKEQQEAAEAAKKKWQADNRKSLKGCAIVFFGAIVAIPLAVAMCFSAIPEGDHSDPNEEAANVAAKEELAAFPWVRDLYVSPGHLNIGVIPGEKEWGTPMITLAVCSTLERHGSDVRRVRFVDVHQIAAGKSPRGAEIIAVDCPDREIGQP